jgi:hypothetical protein
MSVKDDILTVDNLWHALVAVVFTAAWWAGGLATFGGLPGWPLYGAALAGIGLYLREASQVDWDFTLRWSAHKWLEALVGTVAAFIAAAILAVLT